MLTVADLIKQLIKFPGELPVMGWMPGQYMDVTGAFAVTNTRVLIELNQSETEK